MSTLSAVLTVAAVLAVSLPAAYWQIRRARAEESTRDRIIRESLERPDPRWGTDVAVQVDKNGTTATSWQTWFVVARSISEAPADSASQVARCRQVGGVSESAARHPPPPSC